MGTASISKQESAAHLAVYLGDIYDLERRTEKMWSARIEKIPVEHENIKKCLQEHIRLKKNHIAGLKDCLRQFSAQDPQAADKTSPHYISDIGLQLATDDLESDSFCNTAFERFEAAVYRKVIERAEQAGYADIAATCRAILRQEEIVALWLEHALHEVPLSNTHGETPVEAEQGDGFHIDARLMQLRHPENITQK